MKRRGRETTQPTKGMGDIEERSDVGSSPAQQKEKMDPERVDRGTGCTPQNWQSIYKSPADDKRSGTYGGDEQPTQNKRHARPCWEPLKELSKKERSVKL